MKKNKRFELRLSDKDYQQIQAKASQFGLSISKFIRCLATDKQLPPPLTAQTTYNLLNEIQTELNRIGVNLNQIAKACNTSIQLGSPIVVDFRLLEANQRLIKQATQEIEATKKNLARGA